MFPSLLHYFSDQVQRRGAAVALIGTEAGQVIRLNWIELARQVLQRANELQALFDSRPNLPRHVGYISHNALHEVVTALACPLIGAIEVPFDYRLGESAVDLFRNQVGGHWLKNGHPDAQIDAQIDGTPRDFSLDLASACDAIDIESPALVLWTSGTTSDAKGVVLSHRSLCLNAAAKLAAVPQRHDDIRLTTLPLCHAYARTCDLGTWLQSGCTLAVGLGYQAWLSLGASLQPTLANTVPSLAARLLASIPSEVGTGRLRLLGCGGAAMSAADFSAWAERGVTVIQGYGLTESGPVICSATPENAAAGFVGDFVDGWKHDIRDGRLFAKGPHTMLGYWNDPEATRQRIQDGWLDTGDVVQRDAATGQMQILGRADDLIVLSSGYKVNPLPIETRLQQTAGVRHAVVVAAGRAIDVWLDADESPGLTAAVLAHFASGPEWEQPSEIRFFSKPLGNDELTIKGSIRRTKVMSRIRLEMENQQ